MLPELDGWGILEAVRRAGGQTPVLFLTARDAVADRVKGLKLGADDYLVKPFAFSELLARVRSLLRRAPGRQPETLRVADLELDLIRHRAERGGQRLDLTPKEFALLSLLARRRGEVLSRIDRRTGLGHELRQRHERRGRRGQTVAQQGGRSVPAQIDPYRAWVGLCPR
jgi:two-component system copper resistance phosphate regulon response regulator CusR